MALQLLDPVDFLFPATIAMHVVYRLVYLTLLLAILAPLSGCRSNARDHQQAINNLRAEKIQLENQYYLLKSQYESDMRRLGQPVIVDGPFNSFGANLAPGGSMSTIPQYQEPTLATGLDTMISDQDVEIARFIQEVEVSQLPSSANEMARLLIRPLDDRGDVIPIAGDLKIELVDSNSDTTLANYQFDQQQVASMIEQRPEQFPGIHLGLPLLASNRTANGQMICRLRYRTADHRVISQQTELTATSELAGNVSPAQSNSSMIQSRSVSAPLSDTPDLSDITVEIGDETHFDSLGSTSAGSDGSTRPSWSPDR